MELWLAEATLAMFLYLRFLRLVDLAIRTLLCVTPAGVYALPAMALKIIHFLATNLTHLAHTPAGQAGTLIKTASPGQLLQRARKF